VSYSFGRRLGNALVAYVRYLLKTILPVNLSAFYPYPVARPAWEILGAVVLLAALTYAAVRFRQRYPYLLVGWLWYLGTLVPVIGLVQVGMQSMADRYSYVPLVGIFIAAVWGAVDLASHITEAFSSRASAGALHRAAQAAGRSGSAARRTDGAGDQLAGEGSDPEATVIPARGASAWGVGEGSRAPGATATAAGRGEREGRQFDSARVHAGGEASRVAAAGARPASAGAYAPGYALPAFGFAMLAAFSAVTIRQSGYWKSTITLFNHSLDVTTDNPVAENVLANVLAKQGRYDEAISHFEAALKVVPDSETHAHLGLAYAIKGRFDEAIKHYEEALRMKPDDVQTVQNLAEALHRLGRTADAVRHYAEVARAQPGDARVRTNYAAALAELGRVDEAIAEYEEAIRANPAYAEAHNNLGAALASKGRTDDAVMQYAEAVRLKPNFLDARFNLANTLAASGQYDEAAEEFSQLLRLKPDYPNARASLDLVLVRRAAGSSAGHPNPTRR